ncbi:23S rRNA (pseudouridine(1915)-N(3))-methyltransferase RlmH [Vulcanibacillus modesticaldus]|uniref:Ribosomal RNA large subunit methyltransferase H n=1 Tax=Vulcanibacillus modesticaldus TaxID=337097 RepID=A0A1D2YVL0_9BACI|nr:23S rRNA (pseudouridine(1915)-N(3))-methyltransferase RlmH [Vulcanibacillus modesticaldus]OEF99656.1 23S rRNA (pseudouridine(1915)-N(3))-methyltransferase RlmH [Vulcanibacillus modesticaldus]
MRITVISVGKIKEKYIVQGIAEYKKRLSPYAKLQIIEVADEKAPENLSEAEMQQIKQKEGERILQHIDQNQYVIALAIEGEMWSSEKLAKELDKLTTYGNSNIVFVIGGSLGLSKKVYDRANGLLSFSKMTFPHQLMRLILLEQIYRAFKINRGEPYHK